MCGQYKLYPQPSCVPIETTRDTAKRIAIYHIKTVKGLQYQEKNHHLCHTKAIVTLAMFFKDTADTFPEGTHPQSQTPTKPTQPHTLRAMPCNHQQLTQANTPGLIPSPLLNQTTKTYDGEHIIADGAQQTSEGVKPPKQTEAETWYYQPRKKRNIIRTEKRCPRPRSP